MKLLLAAVLLAAVSPLRAQTTLPRFSPEEPSALPLPVLSTPTVRAPVSMLRRDTPLFAPSPTLGSLQDLSTGPGFDGARQDRTWAWRLSMGPMRTSYYGTPLKIRTSAVSLDVSHVALRERHTMHMYKIWEDENPFQFIDEPSNSFLLSAENVKRRYSVNLLVQHPKLLITGEGLNTDVHVNGTIEGQPFESYHYDLNSLYSGYKVTANHYTAFLGIEKIIPVVSGKLGALTYQPGLYAGIHLGYSSGIYKGQSYEGKLGVIGAGVQVDNRLVYHFPKDRVTAALAYHLSASQLKYRFFDGTVAQDLAYQALSFNLGYRLTPKTKKRKNP